MTRTDILKGVYFAHFSITLACGIGFVVAAERGAVVPAAMLGGLFAALFVAKRLQSFFWSELLLGMRKLNQGDPQASKRHSERFLAQLHERPWLKRLIWLGSSNHTPHVELMALNNLGAAELELGEFDSARTHLEAAIALDPLAPLPHHNMGGLILRTGASADAFPWFEKAVALGFDGPVGGRARRQPPELPTVTGAFIVYVLDDDRVPLELVVTALETTFGMTGWRAVQTARRADETGRAACAGFDDAETARAKAEALEAFARAQGHDLRCAVEPG